MPTVFGVKKEIPDKWVVVGMVWLIACLNYTDRMTIFSIFPVFLSDITLALIGSSLLWLYGIFSPIGGWRAPPLLFLPLCPLWWEGCRRHPCR
jgi:hypothetical protein